MLDYRGQDHCTNAMIIKLLRAPSHFERVVGVVRWWWVPIVGQENFIEFHAAQTKRRR
jgi:hypothetical protein